LPKVYDGQTIPALSRWEDLDKLVLDKETNILYLGKYDSIKRQLTGIDKDIRNIDSFQSLRQLINDTLGLNKSAEGKESDLDVYSTEPFAHTCFDTKHFRIIEYKTDTAAEYWSYLDLQDNFVGKLVNPSWCTHDTNTYNDYMKDGKLFAVIDKLGLLLSTNKRSKYQLFIPTSGQGSHYLECKDLEDQEVNSRAFNSCELLLKAVLQSNTETSGSMEDLLTAYYNTSTDDEDELDERGITTQDEEKQQEAKKSDLVIYTDRTLDLRFYRTITEFSPELTEVGKGLLLSAKFENLTKLYLKANQETQIFLYLVLTGNSGILNTKINYENLDFSFLSDNNASKKLVRAVLANSYLMGLGQILGQITFPDKVLSEVKPLNIATYSIEPDTNSLELLTYVKKNSKFNYIPELNYLKNKLLYLSQQSDKTAFVEYANQLNKQSDGNDLLRVIAAGFSKKDLDSLYHGFNQTGHLQQANQGTKASVDKLVLVKAINAFNLVDLEKLAVAYASIKPLSELLENKNNSDPIKFRIKALKRQLLWAVNSATDDELASFTTQTSQIVNLDSIRKEAENNSIKVTSTPKLDFDYKSLLYKINNESLKGMNLGSIPDSFDFNYWLFLLSGIANDYDKNYSRIENEAVLSGLNTLSQTEYQTLVEVFIKFHAGIHLRLNKFPGLRRRPRNVLRAIDKVIAFRLPGDILKVTKLLLFPAEQLEDLMYSIFSTPSLFYMLIEALKENPNLKFKDAFSVKSKDLILPDILCNLIENNSAFRQSKKLYFTYMKDPTSFVGANKKRASLFVKAMSDIEGLAKSFIYTDEKSSLSKSKLKLIFSNTKLTKETVQQESGESVYIPDLPKTDDLISRMKAAGKILLKNNKVPINLDAASVDPAFVGALYYGLLQRVDEDDDGSTWISCTTSQARLYLKVCLKELSDKGIPTNNLVSNSLAGIKQLYDVSILDNVRLDNVRGSISVKFITPVTFKSNCPDIPMSLTLKRISLDSLVRTWLDSKNPVCTHLLYGLFLKIGIYSDYDTELNAPILEKISSLLTNEQRYRLLQVGFLADTKLVDPKDLDHYVKTGAVKRTTLIAHNQDMIDTAISFISSKAWAVSRSIPAFTKLATDLGLSTSYFHYLQQGTSKHTRRHLPPILRNRQKVVKGQVTDPKERTLCMDSLLLLSEFLHSSESSVNTKSILGDKLLTGYSKLVKPIHNLISLLSDHNSKLIGTLRSLIGSEEAPSEDDLRIENAANSLVNQADTISNTDAAMQRARQAYLQHHNH
jgi:hypothetical protein